MKTIRLFILGSCALLASSCLDTEPWGRDITDAQKAEVKEQLPERLEASASSCFENFKLYANVLGSDYHLDYGIGSTMLNTDLRGTDVVSSEKQEIFYWQPMQYRDVLNSSYNVKQHWGVFYNDIRSANALLAEVNPESTSDEAQFYRAQGLATRAYSYFSLVQMFQQPYSAIDPDKALGVPLITEQNADEAAKDGCARATVAETYALILSDLNSAIDVLKDNKHARADKRYVDLAVAYGIRARVNLVMENWAAAADDATAAIAATDATPYTRAELARPGFTDSSDHSWMWGVVVAETDRCVTTGICNFPSFMCSLCYGYTSEAANWRKVNVSLFNQIGSTDVRKGWFLDASGQSSNLNQAELEFLEAKGAPAYTNVKFGPYKGELGTSTNASDIPLMRVEEMYLIQAEAYARMGSTDRAKEVLTTFVTTYRDPSYTTRSATADELADAVWTQRRIELWGEGLSYFDLLRLQKGVDRRGGGFESHTVFNIAAGDNALIYRIPQSELEYNKLIPNDEVGGNPYSSVPQTVDDYEY